MDILPQLVVNSLIAGSIYALISLGFNLIYGPTKFFNLAHGTVAAVGGYAAYTAVKIAGFPLWVGIISAVLASALLGFIIDRFIYAPLRARKASSMVLLIGALGVFTVVQAIIAIIYSSQFQTILSGGISKTYTIAGGIFTDVQMFIFICAVVVYALLVIILSKTKFGRALRAVSDEAEVAEVVGINTEKVIGTATIIGSGIAGLAGVLIGLDTGIEPTMGLGLLLKGVIGSIVGGLGNITGGFIGSYLLGFIENFGIWQFSGEWKDAIAFGVLIIFLIFRPGGIIRK